MERRITFFVRKAEPTSDGWIVYGEVGLGPLQAGDQLRFVMHQNLNEELASLRVTEVAPNRLSLVGGQAVAIEPGDILGGEVIR